MFATLFAKTAETWQSSGIISIRKMCKWVRESGVVGEVFVGCILSPPQHTHLTN